MSRIRVTVLALLLAATAGILALLAPITGSQAGAAPVAARPTDDPPPLDGLRQGTVDRANAALTHRRYWADSGGTHHLSTLHLAYRTPYNYLGANGSNLNSNVYNGFAPPDAYAWCGYFAAAIWTGHMMPDPDNFPRIPDSYGGSQNWDNAYFVSHSAHPALLPTAADVLVWQDNGSTTTGHVGVVVLVNYETRNVTTIEGNQWVYNTDGTIRNKDSIVKHVYHWGPNGPTLRGKHFLGYRTRD